MPSHSASCFTSAIQDTACWAALGLSISWSTGQHDHSTGLQIDHRVFAPLNNWNRNFTMETVLTDLRREMISPHNRKLPQPPEGTMY